MTPEEQAVAGSVSWRRRGLFVIAAAVVGLAVLLSSAFLLGSSVSPGDSSSISKPAESSVDAGFARDMQQHDA